MDESYIIPIFLYGTLSFITLLAIIFFMLIKQNQRRYRHNQELKEREFQFRQELLNARIELQEHLLNEVSQEIHDNVAQVLSLVKVNLYSVGNLQTDIKATNLVNTSSELLDKAINDLRNLSHSNNADLLRRIGLKEAIRKDLDYIDGLKKQSSQLHITGQHYSMPAEQELLIYRIAQEAIHNCIKHAKASILQVSLGYDPQHFTLCIHDNGMGFNLAQATHSEGIGISHMKHRAKVLGSEFLIHSEPAGGTTVTLKIPNRNGQ